MVVSIIMYLMIWQVAATLIGEDIFLPSPLGVIQRLFQLLGKPGFYMAVLFSVKRITMGFLLALVAASVTASLSKRSQFFYYMFEPAVHIIKATPVASIVILILVWVTSRNLSIVIAFLMTYPVLHTSIYEGLENVDKQLIEVGEAYHVSGWKRFRYITLPEIMPFFENGIKVSLAMCFKSGIAAEVIAVPSGSIGEKLYEAKVYLSTPDLFAWTITVIAAAKLFEYIFILLTGMVRRRIEA